MCVARLARPLTLTLSPSGGEGIETAGVRVERPCLRMVRASGRHAPDPALSPGGDGEGRYFGAEIPYAFSLR